MYKLLKISKSIIISKLKFHSNFKMRNNIISIIHFNTLKINSH